MIGIIIASHGDLAESLKNTVQIFVGDIPELVAINLETDSGPEAYLEKLDKTAQQLDSGNGVLFLADLYGGTPANCVLRLLSNQQNWAGVTGVNLTMLFEVVMNRNTAKDAVQLAEMATFSAREGIQTLSLIQK